MATLAGKQTIAATVAAYTKCFLVNTMWIENSEYSTPVYETSASLQLKTDLDSKKTDQQFSKMHFH